MSEPNKCCRECKHFRDFDSERRDKSDPRELDGNDGMCARYAPRTGGNSYGYPWIGWSRFHVCGEFDQNAGPVKGFGEYKLALAAYDAEHPKP